MIYRSVVLTLIAAAFLIFGLVSVNAQVDHPLQEPTSVASDTTTLIFVRHAEKMDDDTNDPSLNKKGQARARQLAAWLNQHHIVSAIYSTAYKRTMETAEPSASHFELPIQQYEWESPRDFIASIMEKHIGETVLIVGHSNTTPYLVNIASGRDDFSQLDEKTYDRIFVVKSAEMYTGEVEELSY